jgi:hypothetical protein
MPRGSSSTLSYRSKILQRTTRPNARQIALPGVEMKQNYKIAPNLVTSGMID